MNLTAGIILIGNELLSGETPDTNMAYIAKILTSHGIQLKEVAIIPDQEDDIIRVVQDFSARFTYVFTTGGIGPTHDDITAEAMGKAFQRTMIVYPEVLEMFQQKYGPPTPEFQHARQRMATIPEGSILIPNKVATAPGFQIENVYVLAGVPVIMRSMMETVAERLERGKKLIVRHVTCHVAEGKIAAGLAQIQKEHPGIEIGSYPHWKDDHPESLKVTIKGFDAAAVKSAAKTIYEFCQEFDNNLELVEV